MNFSFDKLTSQRQKFLKSIGIKKDNIPSSFNKVIKNYNKALSPAERFLMGGEDFKSVPSKFLIRDVVGTDHERYSEKSWLEAFANLDRGDQMIDLYFKNIKYYDELKQLDQSKLMHDTSIGLVRKDDKYFLSRPYGGNNRMILMKIKYLALIEQANGDQNKIDEIDKQFTFVGKVKTLPKKKNTASIYYTLNILFGLFKSNCINISNDPNNPIFRIIAGEKTFNNVIEDQLPSVFEDIISNYDPAYLQNIYETYCIDLDLQQTVKITRWRKTTKELSNILTNDLQTYKINNFL